MSTGLRPERRRRRRMERAATRGARRWASAWLWLSCLAGCASGAAHAPAERAVANSAPTPARAKPATQPISPDAQGEIQAAATQPLEPGRDPSPRIGGPYDGAGPPLSDAPDAAAADSALSRAAFEGDLASVRKLIQDGPDLEARDRYGGTPLMAALRKFAVESKASAPRAGRSEKDRQRAARKLRIARLLIEHGADVRAADQLGHTPLHFAAMAAGDEREVVAVLDALVARGASVNQRTDEQYRRTPLEYAIDQGAVGRVECLLRHGADASVVTAEGKSLEAVAEERGHAALAALLRVAAQR